MVVGFNQKVVGGINILAVLTLKTGETSTRAVPIEDVNTMEKVFSNQNFSKVVRFPDKTKSEIIAKMQELFKSSSESDVNYLYLTCHGGEDGKIAIGSDKTVFTGWDSLQNKIISNTNGKITLEELYQYSYPLVLEDASKIHEEQHVSVYPKNSQFVLFQK